MKREEKDRPLFLLEVWADLLGALRGPREKDESGSLLRDPKGPHFHLPHPVHPATLCSALLREGDWVEDSKVEGAGEV